MAAVEVLVGIAGREPPLVGDLGRNPLFAYMAGGVLTLGLKALAPASSATSLAWGGSFLVLALVAAAALVMDARKIWIKL